MQRAVRHYSFADGRTLELGERTRIMGILNVTPDSFSDGGKWNDVDRALFHMQEMVRDGADVIDLGAESTRPGCVPMAAEEEMERIAPFLESLLRECPVPVSVDTFKPETAELAASMGVHILNDIWGFQYAEGWGEMARVAAKYDLPVIVMHNQHTAEYQGDIVEAMRLFFRESLQLADLAGLKRENVILDAGIGFGKTAEMNLHVLRRLSELAEIDGERYPMLLGASRKSFMGAVLGLPVEERMEATGAVCVLGIQSGCSILRVHDVKQIARMARMADAVLEA